MEMENYWNEMLNKNGFYYGWVSGDIDLRNNSIVVWKVMLKIKKILKSILVWETVYMTYSL